MTQQIGQLSYNVFNPTADPGEPADFKFNFIDSFPINDANGINPGRFVEMNADNLSVQGPQQTGATFAAVGVTVIKRGREGAGAVGVTGYGVGGFPYNNGDVIPVLLNGRIFAEWDPTSTQTAWGRPNVYHSSTIATNRGMVTFVATSVTAGVEIAQAPACVRLRQATPNTGNIVLIDVNLPGA